MGLRIEPLFTTTQKIEPLFKILLKELNPCQNMTQRIEPFFLNVTQRIELFSIWFKKGLFFNMTPKHWTHLFDSKNFFFKWLKELRTRVTELFFLKNMSHRIELFFLHNSQNWTILFSMTHRNWILLFNMTHGIEPIFWIWLKELNHSLIEYDSKNCFVFFFLELLTEEQKNNSSKSWIFLIWFKELNFLNLKNETFQKKLLELNPFSTWLKDLIFFFQYAFFEYDSKNWTLFRMTQRIEPFSSIWREELTNCFLYDSCIDCFLCDSCIDFFSFDSKNWAFFSKFNSTIWTFVLRNMTQRIEPLFNMSQWIEPFFFFKKKWLKELLYPFWTWLTELNPSFQHDSKNWQLLEKLPLKLIWKICSNTRTVSCFETNLSVPRGFCTLYALLEYGGNLLLCSSQLDAIALSWRTLMIGPNGRSFILRHLCPVKNTSFQSSEPTWKSFFESS